MNAVKRRYRERAILVCVSSKGGTETARNLGELSELVESAGGDVIGTLTQRREGNGANPQLGSGKMEELAQLCARNRADVVITQHGLTPIQMKRLEKALPCRIIDRAMLILDIFAQRARSREGKLQVELAQLLYRLPRLLGRGTEMSRLAGRGGQAGAGPGAGAGGTGGMGTRGPGEQELEYDRRRIRERVTRLKKEIASLRQRRSRQRGRRQEQSMPVVVLAGYTNAGKSTLLRSLGRTEVFVKDQMFSTLDPQVRRIRLPEGGTALMCDTVGFISDLPESLRVAFRATLEEIADSDLVIHVVDASHPEVDSHVQSVMGELKALGAESVPRITVINKMDLVDDNKAGALSLASRLSPALPTTATKGDGLGELLIMVEEMLRKHFWRRLVVRQPSWRVMGELKRMGASMRESRDEGTGDAVVEAWLTAAQTAGVLEAERKAAAG